MKTLSITGNLLQQTLTDGILTIIKSYFRKFRKEKQNTYS